MILKVTVRLPSRSYPKLSENVYIWHFYHRLINIFFLLKMVCRLASPCGRGLSWKTSSPWLSQLGGRRSCRSSIPRSVMSRSMSSSTCAVFQHSVAVAQGRRPTSTSKRARDARVNHVYTNFWWIKTARLERSDRQNVIRPHWETLSGYTRDWVVK